ncbi:MAG: potassium channel family protein [Candidatus Limnocylindria bacterium]
MSELRARFNTFVDAHEVPWELTMGMLALAYVATGFVEGSPAIGIADAILTGIFLAEFGARLAAAYDRPAHLRGHWVDAAALVPAIRGFRLLRLLRLLRLVRAFSGLCRAMGQFERLATHRGLLALVVVWLAVVVISSMAFYAAEADRNPNVTSPLDALWWGVVTLTTVGYGDVLPLTPEGRLAAIVLMVLGIGLFSAITATMVTALVGGTTRNGATARLDELDALHTAGRVTEAEYDAKRAAILEDL